MYSTTSIDDDADEKLQQHPRQRSKNMACSEVWRRRACCCRSPCIAPPPRLSKHFSPARTTNNCLFLLLCCCWCTVYIDISDTADGSSSSCFSLFSSSEERACCSVAASTLLLYCRLLQYQSIVVRERRLRRRRRRRMIEREVDVLSLLRFNNSNHPRNGRVVAPAHPRLYSTQLCTVMTQCLRFTICAGLTSSEIIARNCCHLLHALSLAKPQYRTI